MITLRGDDKNRKKNIYCQYCGKRKPIVEKNIKKKELKKNE